jgi:hypothetical protein
MQLKYFCAWLVPLALVLGCNGSVIVDGEGGRGGGGSSGSVNGGGSQGAGGPCGSVKCVGDAFSCLCETTCAGPVMRADCEMDGNTVICECHNEGSYLGTCGQVGESACTLPEGCCTDYL